MLFNEKADETRNLDRLQSKWKDLKKVVREKLRDRNKEIWKTGGSIPSNAIVIEDFYLTVLEIIAPTLERPYSEWDSDRNHVESASRTH